MTTATQERVDASALSAGRTRPQPWTSDTALHRVIGAAAIVVPVTYMVSDALEVTQGGHSQLSLLLTYIGEAPTVFFIVGLCAVQWPRAGWIGLTGAVLYGSAFVFWSGFTLHGLLIDAADLPALAATIGAAYWVNAAVQSVGAILFAAAVIRARVLPGWTGVLLLAAMAAHALLSAFGLPETLRWIASTAQNISFIAMGLTVWLRPGPRYQSALWRR